MRLRRDAAEIRQFFAELPGELGLDPARRDWPRYVYRFDDISRVAQILRRGELLSRERCRELGISDGRQANREIIENSPHLRKYARLFFRPRTPTQYRNEGILPAADVEGNKGAHCPVPVFLLFDSAGVLTLDGVKVTDGSPTRIYEYSIGEGIDFLQSIPFDAVFHDSAFPPDQRQKIIFHRHAEILVPVSLPLDGLRHVVCRTGPERDTLIQLLDRDAPRWEKIIRVERPGENLFFRQGLFVRNVVLLDDGLHIEFKHRGGHFDMAVDIYDERSGRRLLAQRREQHQVKPRMIVTLPRDVRHVRVSLQIEGAIAFQGTRTSDRIFGSTP